jgi:hypothetical protein
MRGAMNHWILAANAVMISVYDEPTFVCDSPPQVLPFGPYENCKHVSLLPDSVVELKGQHRSPPLNVTVNIEPHCHCPNQQTNACSRLHSDCPPSIAEYQSFYEHPLVHINLKV